MRAIIFAAGLGTRISRHIGDKPKCLVDVFDGSLIHYTVSLLRRKGIEDIAVVTGHKADQIEKVLPGDVRVYRNPFYAVSNSIASLWFARDFIQGELPLLAMNGDVFIEDSILDQLLQVEQGDTLAVMVADSSRIHEADYKFAWRNGSLERYGKDLPPEDATGEYVGLGVVFQESLAELAATVESEVIHGNYNKWWEDSLYQKIHQGKKIGVLDIRRQFWVELDFVEDLNRLNQYLQERTPQRLPARHLVQVK